MSAERPAPLHGYIMPLLTPFNADGSVDEHGMRANIAYLIGEGIHGITVTGSFGEFPLLAEQERVRLYDVAPEEAAGRCAVIAGTAHARTEVMIELGDAAARIGMDGVMMRRPTTCGPPTTTCGCTSAASPPPPRCRSRSTTIRRGSGSTCRWPC